MSNRQKSQKFRIWLVIVLAFAVPLMWLLLIPPAPSSTTIEEYEVQQLQTAHKLIDWFRTEFGEVPRSLTELRAYSRYVGTNLSSHDVFGRPLQYLRLDSDHFMLRSFGTDGLQNTLLEEEDHGLISWSALNHPAPVLQSVTEANDNPYSPALLLGSNSPNEQWFAKLFVSRRDGVRHLLVNHRKRQKLFMVAQHDMIEEFVWLPNGYQLIYTATGSDRYSDGLYLWDLLEDRTTNLLEVVNQDSRSLKLSQANRKLWISLNGVNHQRNSVYVYIAPQTSKPLDPRFFYGAERLYEFAIPMTTGSPKLLAARSRLNAGKTDIWSPSLTFLKDKMNLPKSLPETQANFLSLPLQGDVEKTLQAWQQFCSATEDASLPYCLWYLAALFNDSVRLTKSQPDQTADRLRELGAEMALATMKYQLTPSYVRAIAQYMFELMIEEQLVPMRISLLSLPTKN